MVKDTFRHNLQQNGTLYAVLSANIGEIEEFCTVDASYGETYLIINKIDLNDTMNCEFNLVREPAGAMK